ncbi:solute carrier family member bloated tubules isoform X3 [Rhynchophorus ferrugineus]|uniref:solute carrier family member bloated tubules isoform X3 n=1 Tax=Rhynchophorus ferrugineus TaxID=354439 RepID=UPI003FCE88CD
MVLGRICQIAKKWNITEPMYKPKLLNYSPSLRAIKNYNDLPIDTPSEGVDNLAFEPDFQYEYYIQPAFNVSKDSNSKTSNYDYQTMSTASLKTTSAGSELTSNIDATEMGSSVKLVTEKVERSCKTWCLHISTVICTMSMAMGLGNMYRLPQMALIHGGLPFLVVYAVLTVILGLPLLFLELGVGQMAQEGFIKSWRAVPFFKGIGYVKLLAGCFLSLYYPLYVSLAIIYLVWVLKGPVPFTDCANGVVITSVGYSATAKNGQECLRSTFLKRPLDDPYYFSIFAAALFLIWLTITLMSIKRTRSYVKSLIILFFPVLACYTAMTTKSILMNVNISTLLFFKGADWSLLGKAEIWYFATIQIFFSTCIGFGSFVTNAGTIYNKVNPFWTAFGYITVNLIFGSGSVIIMTILTGNVNDTITSGSEVAEVHLFASIYDAIVLKNDDEFIAWMSAVYLLFISSGLISMATLSYSLLKAIYSHDGLRLKRWHVALLFNFSGFILSCLLLLRYDFDLVHLLDHYVVGNLILITVVIEVIAFVAFYGTGRLQSDFEFILGRLLSKFWLCLWWLTPLFLTGVFVWGLATLSLEGIFKVDPVWLYAVGWALVLTAFIFIFAIGVFVSRKQDGYTLLDKLKASLEPSHNWGPKDPMLRHNWVQWNTKSLSGERDFTLKRRGTKDYTKTIKKRAKKEASELSAMSVHGAYVQTDTHSTNSPSTISRPKSSHRNNTPRNSTHLNNGGNYDQLYYISSEALGNMKHHNEPPTEPEASLVDSLEKNNANGQENHKTKPTNRNTYPFTTGQESTDNIRHTFPGKIADKYLEDETSEGYGTFRNKGPYVIEGGDIGHVCYRKYGVDEVTEL